MNENIAMSISDGTPAIHKHYAEPPLKMKANDLRKLANALPSPAPSVVDRLKQPIRLEDLKRAVFKEIFPQLAYLAHCLGYGWVGGVNSNNVGSDYVYVPTGTTVRGSGGYTITGPAFAPNLIQGPNPDANAGQGYMSDLRTSFEFTDVSVRQDGSEQGDPVWTQGQPDSITTFSVENAGSVTKVGSSFTTEVFMQSQVGASTQKSFSDDWHFDVSSTLEVSAGGKGAMFPSVSLSVTASGGESHSKSQSDSTSNSLTDGVTETHTFQHDTPAGYSGEYSIVTDRGTVQVPFSSNSELVFGIKIHGFLRWGGGHPFQGETNYHMNHSGSGGRPTVDALFGGKGTPCWQDLEDQSASNDAPWAWNSMFQQVQGSKENVAALIASIKNISKFPVAGVMATIKRSNVRFKTISETAATEASAG
jgi:hypothetical protein